MTTLCIIVFASAAQTPIAAPNAPAHSPVERAAAAANALEFIKTAKRRSALDAPVHEDDPKSEAPSKKPPARPG